VCFLPSGNFSVRHWPSLAAATTLAAIGLAAAPPHAVPGGWMSEEAMRAAFIGNTLDGYYVDGLRWTETYSTDGRLDYRESVRRGAGNWHFRGNVFCTFYDPGYGLNGGCWNAAQVGSNCYEFYVAGATDAPEDEAVPGPLAGWSARAWRRGEPSTCESRPSV
jgi:hypothetical protein